jgi:hypothetical protein
MPLPRPHLPQTILPSKSSALRLFPEEQMDSGVKGASIALLSSRALPGWASSSPIDGASTRP